MKYHLDQRYVFYNGNVVRMYFIQGMPYEFDELPLIIQEHPEIQNEALQDRDYDDYDLYKADSYLMLEECHPCMFELELDDPELLPQDD